MRKYFVPLKEYTSYEIITFRILEAVYLTKIKGWIALNGITLCSVESQSEKSRSEGKKACAMRGMVQLPFICRNLEVSNIERYIEEMDSCGGKSFLDAQQKTMKILPAEVATVLNFRVYPQMKRVTFALGCDTEFAASIYVNDQVLCIANTILGKLTTFKLIMENFKCVQK